ncbi:allograft inflammatory factor 1-like [Ostrea edulis]|uniref:Allograft inflammatory factor n=1 Tax=Ostrea edulis TaxID=37623 RepID=K9LII8_OSTED|nr:allograft inflammatory factor 1-like [Ostrea edulis]XP_056016216.1 allograft inflammatory factor 1-like [Ostrea edulis]XP_056016218.1 allograft inflammatory factor 1-like [Ostrea edulis]XP_056016219.1 allograft inflammatory factor 1-like [Ostrea edulis]AFJ91809.1 allograft inflammatory factor [Ostrea edulis]
MAEKKLDYQGGKAHGERLEMLDKKLADINEKFLTDTTYSEVENLAEKLAQYKEKFMDFDLDQNLEIDIMSMKRMMEKLGQAKTHLEIQKMIKEVDTTGSETISYHEFVLMMLGGKSTILKLILFFEHLGHAEEVKTGIPPKRTLDSLP